MNDPAQASKPSRRIPPRTVAAALIISALALPGLVPIAGATGNAGAPCTMETNAVQTALNAMLPSMAASTTIPADEKAARSEKLELAKADAAANSAQYCVQPLQSPSAGLPDPPGEVLKCHGVSPKAGIEILICPIWCSWNIHAVRYNVSMDAFDGGSVQSTPTIYAGVSCFWNYIAMPPTGISCGDLATHCEAEYAEGIAFAYGACVFAAEAEVPHITANECHYSKDT